MFVAPCFFNRTTISSAAEVGVEPLMVSAGAIFELALCFPDSVIEPVWRYPRLVESEFPYVMIV